MAANEPGVTTMRFFTFAIIWRCDADQFTYLLHEDVPVLAARYGWGADLDLCHRLFCSFITLRVELVLPVHVRKYSGSHGSGGRGSFAECAGRVPRTNYDDNR